jgi:AAA15 family ATPase/GTPase
MLAEFSLTNYRSFKEKQVFSLISTKNKELSDLNTFAANDKLCFLKTAVIYGANASGKSNFFVALGFFLNFAVTSGPRKQIGDPIRVEPFAFSKQTENEPSSFEIIFYIPDPTTSSLVRYRYGLSINKQQVIYEYLFAVYKLREVMLFTRENQDISFSAYFKEGLRGKPSARNNCTLLSVCAQNNGDISSLIITYFQKMLVTSGLQDLSISTKKELHSSLNIEKVINFLHYADIHIKELKSESIPFNFEENLEPFNEPEVMAFFSFLKKKFPGFDHQEKISFGHILYDGEKPVGKKYLSEESESSGTLKLFSYSMPILLALEQGTPLFIDEFDSMLHPLIIEAIIKLFNSPITNPNNAQLVISCHAINILTNKIFRRDQIWFCEKDQFGATDLYSLAEYSSVRNDALYDKSYLQGKYGAVPYIDDINFQIGTQD